MMSRIWGLTGYLVYRIATSLTAVWAVSAAAVFYWLGFRTRTPESDYFVLVIGLFGAIATFLLVLVISNRANEEISYPIFVRLESRIEFLIAVLQAGFLLALGLQLLIAAAVLLRNAPELMLGDLLHIPPIWLAANLLLGGLALHATDFVAAGWSRVRLFGFLAILIFLAESYSGVAGWLSERLMALSLQPTQSQNAQQFALAVRRLADWFAQSQDNFLQDAARGLFWPFEAIVAGSLRRSFLPLEALAPAVMVIAATILFLLAADVFANKDLILTDD